MEIRDKEMETNSNFIERYTRNLNLEAKNNKIDPIIARDEEIRRLIQILSRKTKNNPVLVGEPGVGKTAIVEGLVQKIVRREVPENLINKIVLELDLPSVVAGAKFQGQFEERLKKIINEIKKEPNKYIIFIDELHIITGAGKAQGSIDAANILKPALARGEIRAIGATTIKEYKDHIEKDAALERRFQKVIVREPSIEETVTILRGIKERYEAYHGVEIHDDAIVAAAELSERYVTDRFLPDKAIDILDEACAHVKMSAYTSPEELDVLNRKRANLEMEKTIIEKEGKKDAKSKSRLLRIVNELNLISKQSDSLEAEWIKQKSKIEKIKLIKEQIQDQLSKADYFQSRGEYEKAAQIKYAVISKLEKDLKIEEEKLIENKNGQSLVKVSVSYEEIAKIVSLATGIPIERLTENEREKLLRLKETLGERVKGQDEALSLVADSIIRSRAAIKDPNKPIGTFLFLGPTGVGKTEVAKTLAETLFGTDKSFVRLDMSEFTERHSVSKIIGAPPGYVGYEDSGHLTEIIRNKPHTILLLDELEKAHSEVFNILLQILDEGHISDSKGKEIDFKNTIIIMTSNLGSEFILANDPNAKEKVLQVLKSQMRPEFLNRIDEIVVFNSLDESKLILISKKFLNELTTKLLKQDINITFTDSLVKHIVENGSDPQYGARPLKRYIQKNLESDFAYKIMDRTLQPGHAYTASWDLKGLKLKKKLAN